MVFYAVYPEKFAVLIFDNTPHVLIQFGAVRVGNSRFPVFRPENGMIQDLAVAHGP